MIRFIDAGVLKVAYSESGAPDGWPVVLPHGFPYDIHAYDGVAPALATEGARVIVPYLRGFGPTRFLSPDTPRSGQRAALGADLLALLDALGIDSAFSPAMIGVDEPPAWSRRSGLSEYAAWSLTTATTSKTSPSPQNPISLRTSTGFGTSIIFIASADALGWSRIVDRSVVCFGACGRRHGGSVRAS